jgi:hypothetical protein
MIHLTCEVFGEEGLDVGATFESEEVSLKPTEASGRPKLRLIIDSVGLPKAAAPVRFHAGRRRLRFNTTRNELPK